MISRIRLRKSTPIEELTAEELEALDKSAEESWKAARETAPTRGGGN